MRPTVEELEEALETLLNADSLGGRDPERPMAVRDALNVVFRATAQQLYTAGFSYTEPSEKEEER